jgi:hypothetical protein
MRFFKSERENINQIIDYLNKVIKEADKKYGKDLCNKQINKDIYYINKILNKENVPTERLKLISSLESIPLCIQNGVKEKNGIVTEKSVKVGEFELKNVYFFEKHQSAISELQSSINTLLAIKKFRTNKRLEQNKAELLVAIDNLLNRVAFSSLNHTENLAGKRNLHIKSCLERTITPSVNFNYETYQYELKEQTRL